ncbi:MAG: hypothetical protein Q9217_004343 [Psora testacea]
MADDDPGEDGDERTIELSAIAAIYPELFIPSENGTTHGEKKASLHIVVEPLRPLPIRTSDVADVATPDREAAAPDARGIAQEVHHLSNLPPLNVEISLPQDYPAKEPPIIHLSTQESWLSEETLKELETYVRTLWEDVGRDQVLYAYIDHLREAAEEAFGLHGIFQASPDLKLALLNFDVRAKRVKFNRETFECGVCLEPKKGSACHRLLCSHVFCVVCLQDFYNTCITEGDVGSVKCLAPKCGDRTLEPSELLQIPLEQEMVQRYTKLKRKKQLESDRTTVYCPRQWCQGPARIRISSTVTLTAETDTSFTPKVYDPSATSTPLPPPADRLAICQDCTFAFCLVCKASWHGEYYTCFPRSQFELTAEERASEEYLKLHTQPCPTCDARAQKTHGCNHMICFKCDTHYCYLCGAYLEKGNPYEHFNNKFKGCYMRLWELEGGDDGEFGHAFAGGAGGVPLDWSSDDGDDAGDELLAAGAVVVPPAAPAPPPLPAAPNAMVANPRPLGDDGRPARPRRGGADLRRREGDGAALRRFLEMVRDDVEDEWDSDEMSGDEIEELEG